MCKLQIVKWPAVLLSVFLLTHCEPEQEYYSKGAMRSEVYSIMGPPSNRDDMRIAFWSRDKNLKADHWREICSNDGHIAVFDKTDRSLLPKISISATSIFPSMSDEEIVKDVTEWGIYE